MQTEAMDSFCLWTTCVLTTIFTTVYGGVICLDCKGVTEATFCTTVRTCGSHSSCYTEAYLLPNGEPRFNLGCRDTQMCPAVVNRDLTVICTECCHKNMCNADKCGTKGYPNPRGPLCYTCTQQAATDSCNQVSLCGRDEACYIQEKHTTNGNYFTTACENLIKCDDESLFQAVFGRDANESLRFTKSNTNQHKCCIDDLCNDNLLVPIDGKWSTWSGWSKCSVTCGGHGSRSRARTCTNPSPMNGGRVCQGSDTDIDNTCADTYCFGPTCLSCREIAIPRDCTLVEQCGLNSECYVDAFLSPAGTVSFNMGCRDKMMCIHAPVGKRQSELSCSECCSGNLCGDTLCGSQAYPAGRGPICYKCDITANQRCSTIEVCNQNEMCSAKYRPVQGDFSLGCIPSLVCMAAQAICCHGDLCNNAAMISTLSTTLPHIPTHPTHTLSSIQTTADSLKTTPLTLKTTAVPLQTTALPTPTTTKTVASTEKPSPTPNPGTGWGSWSPWSACTVTVSEVQGHKQRVRLCLDNSCGSVSDTERRNCYHEVFCEEPVIHRISVAGSWVLGGFVKLTCEVTGNPKPDINWTVEKPQTNVVVFSDDPTSISIMGITSNNYCKYLCRAANECGRSAALEFNPPTTAGR